MTGVASTLASRPQAAWKSVKQAFTAWGPGAVLLMAILGPQDLITNAATGAAHGYGLVWTLPIVIVARYTLLEAGARYVIATGESLLEGYSRLSSWFLWCLLGGIFFKRLSSNLYELLLMADTTSWLTNERLGYGRFVWGVVYWAAGFLLIWRGGYRVIERVSVGFAVLLGTALSISAGLSVWTRGSFDVQSLAPRFPSSHTDAPLFLLALIGSGVGSLSNLKYPALIHHKGWRSLAELAQQRRDLKLSVLGLLVMTALIQILAANTLGGQPIEDAEDLLNAFSAQLGELGRLGVGIGVLVVTFSTFVGSNLGYTLIGVQILEALRKHRPVPEEAYTQRAYRVLLLLFLLPPLTGLFTQWQPIWIAIISAALLAGLLPLVVIGIVLLTRDRSRMGTLANRRWQNVWLVTLVVAVSVLVVQNLLRR